MIAKKNFDVIIIGGSYAGLSAAMALGRSLRNVLIIDGGSPCNKQTPNSHNFITHDGSKPDEISRKAKEQVLKYGTVQFLEDFAVTGKRVENKFFITTQSGKKFTSKKIIFATGIKDIMPEIKGFSAAWGISVIHCPYCHGYEFKGQKTGILSNGDSAFHLASLVNNLTDGLSILTNGKATFSSEQLAKIEKNNINIIESKVLEVEHTNGKLENVVFENGEKISFSAVYATLPFQQHSQIPVSLGCELTEDGYIKVDFAQKTSVEGVFACGDNVTMMRSVSNAVYAGNVAGAVVNMELVQEEF
ncbi:NAD(P)/FAD-dependent oxidoreductase [Tenacibaculum sp.]|uniref:NAD(P)/FAD-dependent oxidoreductase n=1 Tax=Tenacibaculum sp. TaxID=1906242 RepID=UPI003D0C3DDB